MNDTQYLKALKKHLAGLDSKSRDDIVREIASSADDTVQDSLFNRFGAPETLAQQYLDGVTIKPSPWQRLWHAVRTGSKLVIMIIGVLTLLIVAIIYWLINQTDDFDYANVNAKELSSMSWSSLVGVNTLAIEQAQVIMYGSQDNTFAFSCAKDEFSPLTVDTEGVVAIDTNQCFLRIPSSLKNISATQTEIVINGITGDKAMDIFQANLRIVKPFNYRVDANISQCKQSIALSPNVGSSIDSYQMTLTGKQCSIEEYASKL